MLLDVWSFGGISMLSSVQLCAVEFDVVVLLCGGVHYYVFKVSIVVVLVVFKDIAVCAIEDDLRFLLNVMGVCI
jgi:hypothetical protein